MDEYQRSNEFQPIIIATNLEKRVLYLIFVENFNYGRTFKDFYFYVIENEVAGLDDIGISP